MNYFMVGNERLYIYSYSIGDLFANWVFSHEEVLFEYHSFKSRHLTLICESKHMHIDDQLVLPLKDAVTMEVRDYVLEFMVPAHNPS